MALLDQPSFPFGSPTFRSRSARATGPSAFPVARCLPCGPGSPTPELARPCSIGRVFRLACCRHVWPGAAGTGTGVAPPDRPSLSFVSPAFRSRSARSTGDDLMAVAAGARLRVRHAERSSRVILTGLRGRRFRRNTISPARKTAARDCTGVPSFGTLSRQV